MDITILSIEGNYAHIERPMVAEDTYGNRNPRYVDRDDARGVIEECWLLTDLLSCDCCEVTTTDLVKVEDPSNEGHFEWRCPECREEGGAL